MFELLGLAAVVITIGVLASRSDSEEHEEPWACSDKFGSNMPKDVRDQAIAVMRSGTNAKAMLDFAAILRKGGYQEAADCVEARANELIGSKTVAMENTNQSKMLGSSDPVQFYSNFKPPIDLFIPMAPSGVPAAPPKGSGVAGD